MLAVDTNVLVRVIMGDHPDQSRRARELVAENDVWISMTVLLETEWVLRSRHRHAPGQIVAVLRRLAGLPRVTLQDAAATAHALDWCEQSMDLADALHLAAAGHCEAFVTFDKRFGKAARKLALDVREP